MLIIVDYAHYGLITKLSSLRGVNTVGELGLPPKIAMANIDIGESVFTVELRNGSERGGPRYVKTSLIWMLPPEVQMREASPRCFGEDESE
jgi:hypothetical protein